jgi:hypothetical protein
MMHKELIGQEASLRLPCTFEVAALLFGFIEELMEVSGDEPSDTDALEQELQGAVDALCAGGAAERSVMATFEIGTDAIAVRLTCGNASAQGSGAAEQVVTAHQA